MRYEYRWRDKANNWHTSLPVYLTEEDAFAGVQNKLNAEGIVFEINNARQCIPLDLKEWQNVGHVLPSFSKEERKLIDSYSSLDFKDLRKLVPEASSYLEKAEQIILDKLEELEKADDRPYITK